MKNVKIRKINQGCKVSNVVPGKNLNLGAHGYFYYSTLTFQWRTCDVLIKDRFFEWKEPWFKFDRKHFIACSPSPTNNLFKMETLSFLLKECKMP